MTPVAREPPTGTTPPDRRRDERAGRAELRRAIRGRGAPWPPAISNAGPEAIAAAHDRIAGSCRRHHVRRLSAFGSVLRDDCRSESDIDLLVESEPGHVPGPNRLASLEMELTEILGRKVDLLTPMSISPYYRDRALAAAVPLHDAA